MLLLLLHYRLCKRSQWAESSSSARRRCWKCGEGGSGARCRQVCPRSPRSYSTSQAAHSSGFSRAEHECTWNGTETPCCCLQEGWLRCFLSADGVWAARVLTDAKAFYSSYAGTGQFLNPFIKVSADPISRQMKQQWLSNKGVFIQKVLKQKVEDGFFWLLACTCPLEHCLFCPNEMALFGFHPPTLVPPTFLSA